MLRLILVVLVTMMASALLSPAAAWAQKFPKVLEGTMGDQAEMKRFEAYSKDLTENTLSDRNGKWVCTPRISTVCGPEGCTESKKSNLKIYIDFELPRLMRCDLKGCDKYTDPPVVSGMYTFFSSKGGYFLKILNDGTAYMEVSSIWLNAFVKHGSCVHHAP